MDARGRLNDMERRVIDAAVWRLRALGIPEEDLRQEAHIALWERPHEPRLASSVARAAMVQAVRDELGRTDGSPRRVPGGVLYAYEEDRDARVSPDCPEAVLRARQAVRIIEQATPAMRRYVEAVLEHGSMGAAATALGTSVAAVYQPLMRLRARLAAAICV